MTSWNSSLVVSSSVLGLMIVSFFSSNSFLILFLLILSFQEKDILSFRILVLDKTHFTIQTIIANRRIDVKAIHIHAQNCLIQIL